MAVVELKDDSQASRLPLVEEGVVGFWLSGGEGNDQANSYERHSDSQRSIVHKTSHKLSRPANASKLSIFEIRFVFARLDHGRLLPLLLSGTHSTEPAINANVRDAIGDGVDAGEPLAQGEDLGKA